MIYIIILISIFLIALISIILYFTLRKKKTIQNCKTDSECTKQEFCDNGICKEIKVNPIISCNFDLDCGKDKICDSGECKEKVKPIKNCRLSFSDCNEDETCVDGKCVSKNTECNSGDNCDIESTCFNKKCISGASCEKDGDCHKESICYQDLKKCYQCSKNSIKINDLKNTNWRSWKYVNKKGKESYILIYETFPKNKGYNYDARLYTFQTGLSHFLINFNDKDNPSSFTITDTEGINMTMSIEPGINNLYIGKQIINGNEVIVAISPDECGFFYDSFFDG